MLTKEAAIEYVNQLIADGVFNSQWAFNYVPQRISSVNSVYISGLSLPDVYGQRKIYLIDVDYVPVIDTPPVLENYYGVQCRFKNGPNILCDLFCPIAFFSSVSNGFSVFQPKLENIIFTSSHPITGFGYFIYRGWLISFE